MPAPSRGRSRRADPAHRDHDQALALALAVLLLTGSVLVTSCWIGLGTTFAAVPWPSSSSPSARHPASPVAWPVRRALRRLLRTLP
ncbi:hypothetical protein [Streptomyces sp. NBC_00358]|uniref:hypothetical protein n=1 Tax=Streptomyces sp. NBC_00358 TaxID=2975725 RepID=UPI002E271E9F